MVDEMFTRELKWCKLTDCWYLLLRSKGNKKESNIAKHRSEEQLDTTHMPDLESEESGAQRK